MNPYQNALDRCKFDLEDRIKEDNICLCGRMDIDRLQELVDKATLYKPTDVQEYHWSTDGKCKCGAWAEIYTNFCRNCGQALDWESEETE